jgi:hypothetical protein
MNPGGTTSNPKSMLRKEGGLFLLGHTTIKINSGYFGKLVKKSIVESMALDK